MGLLRVQHRLLRRGRPYGPGRARRARLPAGLQEGRRLQVLHLRHDRRRRPRTLPGGILLPEDLGPGQDAARRVHLRRDRLSQGEQREEAQEC